MSTGAGGSTNGTHDSKGTESEKPTIIIAHGAWHGPPAFQRLATSLNKRGFPVVCKRHPSCSDDLDFGQNSLYDDAANFHAEVEKHVNRGKTVYIVGHSYGGTIMTEAITAELGFGKVNGRQGGVAGLAYLCAFMVPQGETNGQQYPQPEAKAKDKLEKRGEFDFDKENNSTVFKLGKHAFYNDLSEEEQTYWNDRLVPMSARPLYDSVSRVAWQHFPSMYMYCTLDVAIPYEVQKNMVKKVKDAGANVIAEHILEAGHSPYLNYPDKVAQYIEDFVNTVESQRKSKL